MHITKRDNPSMNLSLYISLVGDEAAAEMFGIRARTAMSYRLGERKPRPEVAQKIIDKTNGKVDWQGIYAPTESKAAA